MSYLLVVDLPELRIGSSSQCCQISLRQRSFSHHHQPSILHLQLIQLGLGATSKVGPVHKRVINRRVLPLRIVAVGPTAHLSHHALLELHKILSVQHLRSILIRSYL